MGLDVEEEEEEIVEEVDEVRDLVDIAMSECVFEVLGKGSFGSSVLNDCVGLFVVKNSSKKKKCKKEQKLILSLGLEPKTLGLLDPRSTN